MLTEDTFKTHKVKSGKTMGRRARKRHKRGPGNERLGERKHDALTRFHVVVLCHLTMRLCSRAHIDVL
jgi:hypothetical protein